MIIVIRYAKRVTRWKVDVPSSPRSSYTKRGVESRWKQVRHGLMGKVVGK